MVYQTRIEGSVWVCTRVLLDSSSRWSHPRDLLSCRRALGSHRLLGENPSEKNPPGISKGKRKFSLKEKDYEPDILPFSFFVEGYLFVDVCVSLWANVPVWRFPWKPEELGCWWLWTAGIWTQVLCWAANTLQPCFCFETKLHFPCLARIHSVCSLRWPQSQQHLPAVGPQGYRHLPAQPPHPFLQEAVL